MRCPRSRRVDRRETTSGRGACRGDRSTRRSAPRAGAERPRRRTVHGSPGAARSAEQRAALARLREFPARHPKSASLLPSVRASRAARARDWRTRRTVAMLEAASGRRPSRRRVRVSRATCARRSPPARGFATTRARAARAGRSPERSPSRRSRPKESGGRSGSPSPRPRSTSAMRRLAARSSATSFASGRRR